MKYALPIRVVLMLSVMSAVACKHHDADKDTITYELFPSTRLLAAADLESITADGEDGTLVFEPAPAVLADLQPGMVLVGAASSKTPAGLLRGVGAMTRDGDRLTLRTMVVPVQFAFKKLAVHVARDDQSFADAHESRDPNDSGLRELHLFATAAEGTASLKWVLFDGDGDEATEDDQVRLGVVVHDGLGDVLQHHRLAGLGRRHDQAALALADRRDHVEDAPGDGRP